MCEYTEKGDFNQPLGYAAPKLQLKYTTVLKVKYRQPVGGMVGIIVERVGDDKVVCVVVDAPVSVVALIADLIVEP